MQAGYGDGVQAGATAAFRRKRRDGFDLMKASATIRFGTQAIQAMIV
jgi:hypothetical protein